MMEVLRESDVVPFQNMKYIMIPKCVFHFVFF